MRLDWTLSRSDIGQVLGVDHARLQEHQDWRVVPAVPTRTGEIPHLAYRYSKRPCPTPRSQASGAPCVAGTYLWELSVMPDYQRVQWAANERSDGVPASGCVTNAELAENLQRAGWNLSAQELPRYDRGTIPEPPPPSELERRGMRLSIGPSLTISPRYVFRITIAEE